ncbi:hypothetical protein [Dietzia kunjamensis]|uniref:hypothetical protein n=1 Tax=Dietzia kunjamensis TaxID=322509 RepID=UPI0039BD0804
MNPFTEYPAEDLNRRLTDTDMLAAAGEPMRTFLDRCLHEWAGVSLEDATVGDVLRASRAALRFRGGGSR